MIQHLLYTSKTLGPVSTQPPSTHFPIPSEPKHQLLTASHPLFASPACLTISFSFALHKTHVPPSTKAVNPSVSTKYNHTHDEYTRPSPPAPKSKNVVLKKV